MNPRRFPILFPLVVLLLVAGCSRSAAQVPQTESLCNLSATPVPQTESLARFLLFYYRAPDPDRAMAVVPAVEECVAAVPEKSFPLTEAGCRGFYAGAVATSPERAGDWRTLRDGQAPGWLRRAVDIGLAAPEERTKVLDVAPEAMTAEAYDFLWGWFLATGDPAIPRRLIRYAARGDGDASSGTYPPQLVRNSLDMQAYVHPAIKEALNAFAREASEEELANYFIPHPEWGGNFPDSFTDKVVVYGASDDDLKPFLVHIEDGYSVGLLLEPDAFDRVMQAVLANPDALERAMHDAISAAHREAGLEDAAP